MKKITHQLIRIGLIFTLFLFFVNSNSVSQITVKADPEKAKKELEIQRKQSMPAGSPKSLAEYSINRQGDLVTVSFSEKSTIVAAGFFERFAKELGAGMETSFQFSNSVKDNDGYTHLNYDQFYHGIKVTGGQFILHEKNGKLAFANGKLYNGFTVNTNPQISKEQAVEISTRSVAAQKYLWQNSEAEKALKAEKKDPAASYYPSPELTIVSDNNLSAQKKFRLAYKLSISAEIPFKRLELLVDAHTGEIISSVDLIKHLNVPSTGTMIYSGSQTFTTDRIIRNFRLYHTLEESATRPIVTRNMLNGTDYSKAAQITNITNRWDRQASALKNIEVRRVNNNWQDFFDDRGNRPDIYIKIEDFSGTVIYSTEDNVVENARFPLTINLNGITLLDRNLYTIKLYDKDSFSPDDLLGNFSFSREFGTSTLFNNGSVIRLRGMQTVSGALDAHWGMERVYDYYAAVSRHNRKSYDGSNSQIKSYVHPNSSLLGGNANNAFWDPALKNMNFLDGDGLNEGSQTALDVCGHEFSHGVIQFNGRNGLNPIGEGFSLEESFGDIMGTAVEFSVAGYAANWTFSEKTFLPTIPPNPSPFTRSLENPKANGHPDTYLGTNWASSAPHARGGVQNKWFYLLCNGGTGQIDGTGPVYEVPNIGIATAEKIVYHNYMNVLTYNADYKEAFLGSLSAAEMKGFPNPTDTYKAVREAWFAVGVAKRPVISSFTPENGPIGTTVTITGSDFTGISYVGFNDTWVAAPNFTVSADFTQITVDVPAGATTGPISIVAGFDTVTTVKDFTVGCDAPLTVTVSSSDATSFSVNVTGGTAPYIYSLNNVDFQADNVFTNLATGTAYIVFVKDINDCNGFVSFFLSDPIECNVQSGSGGQGTSFITQNLGPVGGSVQVSYEMYSIPDQMEIYYDNELLTGTPGLVSGSGVLEFTYTPNPNGPFYCIIKMFAPNSGTAWDFIANCPVPSITGISTDAKVKLQEDSKIVIPAVDKSIILYPNPTVGNANLRITGIKTETVAVSVTDLTGKEVWSDSKCKIGTVLLPMGQFSAGTYIVSVIYANKEKKTMKLVKTK